MTITAIIGFGFFFAVGFAIGDVVCKIILLTLKEMYIRAIVKKLTKKPIPTKPKGMEFGGFNK